MKTILIATDFSNASRNAAKYGVELAKALNANVILFNAYNIPRPATGLNVGVSKFGVMVATDQKLLDEADILDPEKSLIESICDEGAAEEAILKIANEREVDFIISGMKGRGKNLKKLFGSTSIALAKKTNIPLIIIPEDAGFKKPLNIVFATDDLEASKELPRQLTTIIRCFSSKLYVVKVFKNKKEEWFGVQQQAGKRDIINEVPDLSYPYPAHINLQHALSGFANEYNADMLIMTPHKHEWLERLFSKSETTGMIFHTKIPLLALPGIQDSNAQVLESEIAVENYA